MDYLLFFLLFGQGRPLLVGEGFFIFGLAHAGHMRASERFSMGHFSTVTEKDVELADILNSCIFSLKKHGMKRHLYCNRLSVLHSTYAAQSQRGKSWPQG